MKVTPTIGCLVGTISERCLIPAHSNCMYIWFLAKSWCLQISDCRAWVQDFFQEHLLALTQLRHLAFHEASGMQSAIRPLFCAVGAMPFLVSLHLVSVFFSYVRLHFPFATQDSGVVVLHFHMWQQFCVVSLSAHPQGVLPAGHLLLGLLATRPDEQPQPHPAAGPARKRLPRKRRSSPGACRAGAAGFVPTAGLKLLSSWQGCHSAPWVGHLRPCVF